MESSSFNQGLTEASKSGSKRIQNLATKTKRTDIIVCLRCMMYDEKPQSESLLFISWGSWVFSLKISKRFSYFKYTIGEGRYVRRKEGVCIRRKIEDNVFRVKGGRIPGVRKALYPGESREGRCIRERKGDVYQGKGRGGVSGKGRGTYTGKLKARYITGKGRGRISRVKKARYIRGKEGEVYQGKGKGGMSGVKKGRHIKWKEGDGYQG